MHARDRVWWGGTAESSLFSLYSGDMKGFKEIYWRGQTHIGMYEPNQPIITEG